MMALFKKLWDALRPKASFRIATVQADAVADAHISYGDLFDRKLDALIIKGFYDAQEVARIKQGMDSMDRDRLSGYGGRYTSIPPVFEKLNKEGDVSYFARAQQDLSYLKDITQVDFEEKNFRLFQTMATQGETIASAPFSASGDHFPSGCLRSITPDYGIIRIHADNDFYRGKEQQYGYFLSQVDVRNHVSYIAMIQKAETGGNLVLHDIEYDAYAEIDNAMNLIHRTSGQKNHVDTFRKLELKLDEGDLILFSGGQIWHSVSRMGGQSNRYTYGGFSAWSLDRKHIYLWT
jgi:hypothetical protein